MNKQRISGFQWAIMIFIFFIITYAAPIILKDLQGTISLKTFVFDLSSTAPFIAALVFIIVFSKRKTQLGGLQLTINLKVIERFILALILPLAIFLLAMVSFNVFADSFVLLQTEDLSVSITSIIIGQLVMAFLIEFGFRSYLQNIVETKMNTFFASIIVGIMYSIWNINVAFSFEYTLYGLLYTFAFSMIIGELIRATKGRTIYIATIFHAAMSFGLVFLFNEELGSVFAMKVIALSTSAVAIVYILLSIIIRTILYFFTKRNLDEVDTNNYLDHVNEYSENENQQFNKDDETIEHVSSENQITSDDETATKNNSVNTDATSTDKTDLKDTESESASEQTVTNNTYDNQQETNHDASRNNIISQHTPKSTNQNHQQSQDDIETHANSAVENSTEKAHPEEASEPTTDNMGDSYATHQNTQYNDKKPSRSPFKHKNDHRR